MKIKISILTILCIIFLVSGCISNEEDNNKNSSLDIMVKNLSSSETNVTVKLNDENNNLIINQTLFLGLKFNEGYRKTISLDIKPGDYYIYLFVDENRSFTETITVQKIHTNYPYAIYDNEIKIIEVVP